MVGQDSRVSLGCEIWGRLRGEERRRREEEERTCAGVVAHSGTYDANPLLDESVGLHASLEKPCIRQQRFHGNYVASMPHLLLHRCCDGEREEAYVSTHVCVRKSGRMFVRWRHGMVKTRYKGGEVGT